MTLYLYEKVTTEYLDTLREGNIILIGKSKTKRYYISRSGDIIKLYDHKGFEYDVDIDSLWRRKK